MLLPKTEYFDDSRFKRFKISSKENSIRDYWGNHYFSSEEELHEQQEEIWNEDNFINDQIKVLDLVVSKKAELSIQDSSKIYKLRNKGLIIENGSDFIEYRIESWFPELKRNAVHLRLYVKKNPIRVYDRDFRLIKKIEKAANM